MEDESDKPPWLRRQEICEMEKHIRSLGVPESWSLPTPPSRPCIDRITDDPELDELKLSIAQYYFTCLMQDEFTAAIEHRFFEGRRYSEAEFWENRNVMPGCRFMALIPDDMRNFGVEASIWVLRLLRRGYFDTVLRDLARRL